MNQAHLHLLFNHAPIIGALIGMLTLTSGYLFKNNYIKRTALGIFVFSAVAAIPAFLTGEGAEDAVENLPGVTKDLIEKHEEMGEIFIWLIAALGVLSLLTFFTDLAKNSFSKILYIVTLLLSLATTIVAQQIGTSGGEIRHTEIRAGAPMPVNTDGGEENEKDKD